MKMKTMLLAGASVIGLMAFAVPASAQVTVCHTATIWGDPIPEKCYQWSSIGSGGYNAAPVAAPAPAPVVETPDTEEPEEPAEGGHGWPGHGGGFPGGGWGHGGFPGGFPGNGHGGGHGGPNWGNGGHGGGFGRR